MPEVTKNGLDKPIDIHMRVVRNGVTLKGMDSSGECYEYVYTNMEKALKEVPGLISVLKESEKVTEKDLDEEEEKINKSQEKEDY